MDIVYLNTGVRLQVLAQLGDEYVNLAGIEIVVVNPDGLQCQLALQDLITMCTQQCEKFALLSS